MAQTRSRGALMLSEVLHWKRPLILVGPFQEQMLVAGSHGMPLMPWVRNVAVRERPTAQNWCRGYLLLMISAICRKEVYARPAGSVNSMSLREIAPTHRGASRPAARYLEGGGGATVMP